MKLILWWKEQQTKYPNTSFLLASWKLLDISIIIIFIRCAFLLKAWLLMTQNDQLLCLFQSIEWTMKFFFMEQK